MTTLREKLIKIGAKVVRHGRYVTFQMAEVAVFRDLFREILRLIDGLRRSPPALAWPGEVATDMTEGEVWPGEQKSAQIGPAMAFGFPNPNPYGQERVLSFPDPPSSAIIRASSRGI